MSFKTATYLTYLCLLGWVGFSCNRAEPFEPVDYVDPYIGNISHLLVPTYPTVHLPNSMLRVYPERAEYTTDRLRGLPVVVTSHRGSSAFTFSPAGRKTALNPVITYSYDLERTTPYDYHVRLDEENIDVDFAVSHQAGIYNLLFDTTEGNRLVIRTSDGALETQGNSFHGYETIDGTKTRIYLYGETLQSPSVSGVLSDGMLDPSLKAAAGRDAALVLEFADTERLDIRYGISFIGWEQARKNLEREIPDYDLQAVARTGRDIWNRTLGKIKVEGKNHDDMVVFYTSLYRTYERMIEISEDGRYYSAYDGKIHDNGGVPFFTDDWIWDTYRATHPLRIIIEPDKETAMIASYIRMAQQSPEGWMPTFPEVTGDTHRMNGNHSVAVIADAYCKGLRNFDIGAAYAACKASLTEKSLIPWTRIPLTDLDRFYHENGYYPGLAVGETETEPNVHPFERRQSISVMLAHSYDSWCLANIAGYLGREDERKAFEQISLNYRNVFNAETGFFHPRNSRGDFITPFDYRYDSGVGCRDHYGENNAWIYRWDVQHNIADLIGLMGGPEKTVGYLEDMFNEPLGEAKWVFYGHMPDHTGNVGQFSMANEPCLHIPYLYNYAGQPWKTQKRIRTLLRQWFRNDLMGQPGDEDGGGMSAFVVFSQLGFYPVTPGLPMYVIGSPVFEKAEIELANGRSFRIECRNYDPAHKYIRSATLNGRPLDRCWFTHEELMEGGTLSLTMGLNPDKTWATGPGSAPPSFAMPQTDINL